MCSFYAVINACCACCTIQWQTRRRFLKKLDPAPALLPLSNTNTPSSAIHRHRPRGVVWVYLDFYHSPFSAKWTHNSLCARGFLNQRHEVLPRGYVCVYDLDQERQINAHTTLHVPCMLTPTLVIKYSRYLPNKSQSSKAQLSPSSSIMIIIIKHPHIQ